jgi:hypothetical protein
MKDNPHNISMASMASNYHHSPELDRRSDINSSYAPSIGG